MPQIKCPKCGTMLKAPSEVLGKKVSCYRCNHVFVASAAESGPPPSYPPAYAGPPVLPGNEASPGSAIASLVLGIISIPTCLLYGVPSLVCGILGVIFANSAQKSAYPRQLSSSSAGMAKAGLVCGWIGIALSIAFWVILIIFASATCRPRRYYY